MYSESNKASAEHSQKQWRESSMCKLHLGQILLCSLLDSWSLAAVHRAPVVIVSRMLLYAYWSCFLNVRRTLSVASKSMPWAMPPPLKWRSALVRSV